MQKQLQEVLEFHQKFDVYSNTTPTVNLPHDAYLLRKHIMQEEVSEYSEEYEREGLSDDERLQAVAKELADIIYTALGTVIPSWGSTEASTLSASSRLASSLK